MSCIGFHRGEAAQDLLHEVGLHVAVQQRFFAFLGQHFGLVERDVALDRDLVGAMKSFPLPSCTLKLSRYRSVYSRARPLRVQRQDLRVANLAQDVEDGVGAWRAR